MSTTTETTTTELPIAQITIGELNPRSDIDEDALAELTRSVKSLGVINPISVREVIAPGGGEGASYLLVTGQRRLLAATAAGLETIPAIIRTGETRDDEGIAVAENVIRADLTPLEEASAYQILVDQTGSVEAVATLVGRSAELIEGRLRLLLLPETTRQRIADKQVTLACVPDLAVIAEKHPALCDAVADLIAEDPESARDFPDESANFVRSVLEEKTLAWSAGGYSDPAIPRIDFQTIDYAALLDWLSPHTKTREAWDALPPLPEDDDGGHNYKVSDEKRRRRRLLALSEEEVDAARAYGCLIELHDNRGNLAAFVTDPEWVDEHVSAHIQGYEPGDTTPEKQKKQGEKVEPSDKQKAERAEQREADYSERTAARGRNLDVGAAMAKYEPTLSLDEVKLLCAIVLHHHGDEASYAYRFCVEQPVKVSKQTKRETVQYPRGKEAQDKLRSEAWDALNRAKTPEAAAAVVLRLLVAHHLVDDTGIVRADTMGTGEAPVLASKTFTDYATGKQKPNRVGALLDKLASRLAPASVKKRQRDRKAAKDA